eukprot:14408849-Ditylum_brightwellii.AAC.1
MVHLISGLAMGIPIAGAISLISVLIGRASFAAVDSAMYSTSVVLKAISLWRQLNHVPAESASA